ncbi:hypothetical protein [Enorma massiliensis]|uniref:hypothetical protein n=1 Tax=Enorma massiliensis TaxID=1472761 RepID=UPI003AF0CDAA
MEPQTFDFKPDAPKLSKEMQATLAKTEAALKQMWAREKQEAKTIYEITIPAQTLTIVGKEHAEQVLKMLKGLRLSGTYRVTRK